jgi:hypothetical protein
MGINIDAIRNKLNTLQNTQKKSDLLWKPTPGKHQVRIVPYKFRPDNPFIELYFHYNVNNKTYLSPVSIGNPDPINEFADRLKQTGDKEDWKAGKNMEPKLRTFVPIIVRGKENEGVKFWGFGKTVYQELLAYIADPDYGDITHPTTGRDVTIEYTSAKDAGTSYPTTTIRVKPNQSPISDNMNLAKKLVGEQSEITDIYSVLSYDELQKVLETWLEGGSGDDDSQEEEQAASQSLSGGNTSTNDDSSSEPAEEPTTSQKPNMESSSTKVDEVDEAFSKLFD